jgi:hypothetical protein
MDQWFQIGSTDDFEDPPTLGVREPRKPKPPTRTGGAEADLLWTPEPVEAVAGSGLSVYPTTGMAV